MSPLALEILVQEPKQISDPELKKSNYQIFEMGHFRLPRAVRIKPSESPLLSRREFGVRPIHTEFFLSHDSHTLLLAQEENKCFGPD